MPFIHTSLTQNGSTRPKTTTMYVYNMSLFLVDSTRLDILEEHA
jgi:hypothetical protein